MPLSNLISPNPQVNVTQYLGRWYQIAASLTVNATFEAGTVCVAANYDVNPNGTIGVHNTARNGSPSGTPNDIDGWASAEDPTKPAALTVHLQGVPVAAPCESPRPCTLARLVCLLARVVVPVALCP